MRIFHELPLSLMSYGYKWTDGDYCLPHLLDKYIQYRTYFQNAKSDNRFIIMDNGLFEGITHTTEDLLDKINLIKPNIFIVPDEWNNSFATLRNAKQWMINYKKDLPDEVNLMAVCQGKTIGELILTYQSLIDMGYTHISFNHSSIAYTEFFPNYDKLKAQMYGRMEFIRRLVQQNVIRGNVYHHLLGVSLPQEVMAYTDWEFIKSIDTSNPIIVGYKGERYKDNGIDFKPSEKIEDLFDKSLEDKLEDIIFNIEKFKKFTK